jgi:hypothetical protein
MNLSGTVLMNSAPAIRGLISTGRVRWSTTLALLVLRMLGFAGFQALIAGIYSVSGAPSPWQESIAWWPVSGTLTNLVSIFFLNHLFHFEGARWLDLFRFQRATLGRDLLTCLGLGLVLGPLGMLPSQALAGPLLGSPEQAYALFFHPIAPWAAVLSLVFFPLTIALGELPLYFGYGMPRLEALGGARWAAVLLPALFLAAQHAALPLIFNLNFMLWRFLMFLPFAVALGVILRWRPRLLPYLCIIHGLLDLATMWFVFAASFGIAF